MAINGSPGNDQLSGSDLVVDIINGKAGDDTIFGLGLGDSLNGDEGNDRLFGGEGNDTLHGGLDGDFFTDAAIQDSDRLDGGNARAMSTA